MGNSRSKEVRRMKKKVEGVYTTHEQENLLFVRAKVNGILCAAYVKNGVLVSYEPWEEINRQMYSGPCMNFTVPDGVALGQPNAC